jgi:hypothetical protein
MGLYNPRESQTTVDAKMSDYLNANTAAYSVTDEALAPFSEIDLI